MVWLLRFQRLRYAIGALSVLTALLLTHGLSAWAVTAQISFLLGFIAVTVGAWCGGVVLGLLTTGATALLCNYFFFAPTTSFMGSTNNFVALGLLSVGSTLASLFCGKLWSAQSLEARTAKQRKPHTQVQPPDAGLEQEVQRRTAQLRLVSEFEAALKRITDKVRDSLDEAQILQTAVQELGAGMGVSSCNAGLYDLKAGTSTIAYEYNPSILSFQGHVIQMSELPELYAQLLEGQYCQFCSIHTSPIRGRVAMLVCPIKDDREVLGDLWLITDRDYGFNDLDLRLVQQVANQCAIALRQARLYRAAQTQVAELEALNQLKDDFLSTVSHELRTPVSNMKLSIRMVELVLEQTMPDLLPESKLAQYLQILRSECEREIQLINDLLDLQRLEAGTRVANREPLALNHWLPPLVARFEERAQSRQQTLQMALSPDLPMLWVDSASMDRILTELLNNACKYTPPGEAIAVTGSLAAGKVQLQIQNTGIEIAPNELPHIFEKFYRIVGSDRWKQGGTGLGLTLVRRLVDHMDAVIAVESGANQTTFTLTFSASALDQESNAADNASILE